MRRARQYRSAEIEADVAVHLLGMFSGAIGAAVLVVLAAASGEQKVLWSTLVYTASLLAMLGFSAAYHLSPLSERREFLRRLDHAAIFALIAGTYTPFTVCVLAGTVALWSTISIWLAAIAGAAVKLTCPDRVERASIVIYLALGWAVLLVARPLFASVDKPTAALVVAGGVLYTAGAAIYRRRNLRFHDSAWHGLVLLAAGCHYAAILRGVILTAG